jgi:hypothetical protein
MTYSATYGTAVYGDSYYGLVLLECGAGSYTITGGDASFIYDQVLQGNAGSYTLTGNDAGLDYDQLLNCEAGSYTLTGNDCTFLYDQTIYAGAFSFIWSGQEAGLIHNHILNAEAGAYSLTGQPADLAKESLVNGNAGNYIYTGKDADLVYNSTPVVVVESKGGIGKKEKKKREAEKASREELEAIVKREFDILDGTYQPEVVEVAKQAVLPKIKEIDYTQYQIALAQVNALLLQAKIRAAEYESELDDEEALLMLL